MAASIERERQHLALADRHIAEWESIIERQRELIRDLAERGREPQLAQETLNVLEATRTVSSRGKNLACNLVGL